MALIIIPARYASTRYPGKPLALLKDSTGESKTLIQRTYETAKQVSGEHTVVVATDNDLISQEVQRFGGEVIMTSSGCLNGSERCAEVVQQLSIPDHEVIVNLQGDSPLTPPHFINSLVSALDYAVSFSVATPVLQMTPRVLQRFSEDLEAGIIGGTTVVMDKNFDAMYFSKRILPYTEDMSAASIYHHIGVYAYTAEALTRYVSYGPGYLEMEEGLEQLRFLENGDKIKCVPVASPDVDYWELNNPIDALRIEAML